MLSNFLLFFFTVADNETTTRQPTKFQKTKKGPSKKRREMSGFRTSNVAQSAVSAASVEFSAGLTATLRRWSALKAAVDGQWGGVESGKKVSKSLSP